MEKQSLLQQILVYFNSPDVKPPQFLYDQVADRVQLDVAINAQVQAADIPTRVEKVMQGASIIRFDEPKFDYDSLKHLITDYEEILESHRALVKQIDTILNGADAAEQASLCDLVGDIQKLISRDKVVKVAFSTVHDIPGAMKALTSEWAKDKSEGSYYYGWQSNIATAFVDAISAKEHYLEPDYVKEVANTAAKNLLNRLIADGPDKVYNILHDNRADLKAEFGNRNVGNYGSGLLEGPQSQETKLL